MFKCWRRLGINLSSLFYLTKIILNKVFILNINYYICTEHLNKTNYGTSKN